MNNKLTPPPWGAVPDEIAEDSDPEAPQQCQECGEELEAYTARTGICPGCGRHQRLTRRSA